MALVFRLLGRLTEACGDKFSVISALFAASHPSISGFLVHGLGLRFRVVEGLGFGAWGFIGFNSQVYQSFYGFENGAKEHPHTNSTCGGGGGRGQGGGGGRSFTSLHGPAFCEDSGFRV